MFNGIKDLFWMFDLSFESAPITIAYKKDDSFGLVYVENPRVVRGNIEIVNVNEVKVNGEVMYTVTGTRPCSHDGCDGDCSHCHG